MTREEFKNIYDQYVRAIRNYVYYRSGDVAIADDITQETFIKIWEKQFLYDPKRLKSLLYKIANEKFLDLLKRKRVESDYISEFKFNLKVSEENGSDKDELRKRCETALVVLTEKERTVFLMSRKDDMKYSEISECLGISVKAVEKRMGQALKKLNGPSV